MQSSWFQRLQASLQARERCYAGAAAGGRLAMRWQELPLPHAQLRWLPQWLPAAEADACFDALRDSIPWEIHHIRLFGRSVASPRLSCWIGDAAASYTYSGTRFAPHAWPPLLATLRQRVEAVCATRFNSVLANLYRDGNDSMGWHSDDEPELGAQPIIASLSFGAPRRFRLRRRRARGESLQTGDTHELLLPHGSLLLMAGNTQRNYRHDVPRMRGLHAARLNLTFRWIAPPAGRHRSSTE